MWWLIVVGLLLVNFASYLLLQRFNLTPYQKKRFGLFLLLCGGILCVVSGISQISEDNPFKGMFSGYSDKTIKMIMIIGVLVIVWGGIVALNKVKEGQQNNESGKIISGGISFLTGIAVFGSLVAIGALIWLFANKLAEDDMRDRPEKYAKPSYPEVRTSHNQPPAQVREAMKKLEEKKRQEEANNSPGEKLPRDSWSGGVSARAGWVSTGVNITSNDSIMLFYANGTTQWATAYWVDEKSANYEGTSKTIDDYFSYDPSVKPKFLNSQAKPGQLIFKINNRMFTLKVGESIKLGIAGKLMVAVNDTYDGFDDNKGELDITVSIFSE